MDYYFFLLLLIRSLEELSPDSTARIVVPLEAVTFPKVTYLFCQLPLPTLFYQLNFNLSTDDYLFILQTISGADFNDFYFIIFHLIPMI